MNPSQESTKPAPYADRLAGLKAQLAGAPYCKDVHELLPELSEHAIRNLVNGRGENELVLTALRLVLDKRAQKQQSQRTRLQKTASRWGLSVPA